MMHVFWVASVVLAFGAQDPKPDELTQDVQNAVKNLGSDKYSAVQDARTELVEIGREAVPHLVKALQDSATTPQVRHMICEILGAIRDARKEVVDALTAALNDTAEYGTSIASAAAASLASVGDKAAAPALLKTLQDKRCDNDKQLKYECIRALGILRSKEASEALRKALEDEKTTAADQHDEYAHTIAAAAADALGKLRFPEAIDDLGKLLDKFTEDKFSQHTLRWHAARALERITGLSKGDLDGDEKDDDGKPTAVQTSVDAWKTWFNTEHKGKKNAAETKEKVKKVHDAVEAFRKDQGRLPTLLAELSSKPADAKTWPEKGYFPADTKDSWGRDLVFRQPGTGADFDVLSHGADGRAWGGGFDADLYDHEQWAVVIQKRNQEKHADLVKAIQKFKEEHGKYPEQFMDLVRKPSYAQKWDGPYVGRERYDVVVAAIKKFQENEGQLPKALKDLKDKPDYAKKWEKPYLEDLNDAYGSPFEYKAPGTGGQPFDLSSFGLPRDAFENPLRYSAKGTEGEPFDLISYGADRAAGGTGVDEDLRNRGIK